MAEKNGKESVMEDLKELSRYLLGRTKENHDVSHSFGQNFIPFKCKWHALPFILSAR